MHIKVCIVSVYVCEYVYLCECVLYEDVLGGIGIELRCHLH